MSSLLLKLRHWFVHGGSFKLRPYESACMTAWRNTLTEKALGLLDKQCERLTVYQRYSNERLLCFYDMTDQSCEKWPVEILFPCKMDEIAVARLQLRIADAPNDILKADVTLCHGRFFGLEFNKAPKCHAREVEVVDVKTLVNPMIPSDVITTSISMSAIPLEYREWLQNMAATDMRQPLTISRRDALIQAIDAKLPNDYIGLVSATEGATIGPWRISGLTQIRTIAMPDCNYYLIAETLEGRAIGVAREGAEAELYLFSTPEADMPESVGPSLLRCIERDMVEGTTNPSK